MSYGIEHGFSMDMKPPKHRATADDRGARTGYDRIHREAVARVRALKPEDLDRSIPFFRGTMTIRDILWNATLAHGIHHRGQLSLMCRLAGGTCPGLYGPNREEMAAMRAGASRV
jgi:uncharacterized damage-inducible protein DinB